MSRSQPASLQAAVQASVPLDSGTRVPLALLAVRLPLSATAALPVGRGTGSGTASGTLIRTMNRITGTGSGCLAVALAVAVQTLQTTALSAVMSATATVSDVRTLLKY